MGSHELRVGTCRSAGLAFLAALAACVLAFSTAIANPIPVDTPLDEMAEDNACSLREAIEAANAYAIVSGCPAGNGSDVILLAAGRYTITAAHSETTDNLEGDYDIFADLSILGAGAERTVIDGNGCGTFASYTLFAPGVLNVIATAAQIGSGQIGCNGASDGSINASIAGGIPNYTIAWTGPNGFTASTEDINNVVAGSYTITVTDVNGCTSNATVVLNEPAVPRRAAGRHHLC